LAVFWRASRQQKYTALSISGEWRWTREVASLEHPPIVVLCSSAHRSDIAADPRPHGADAFYCKEHFGSGFLREVWARYGATRHNGASTCP
jgi:hypothetical protein